MKKLTISKEGIALVFIAMLSGALNFANISKESFGNTYYSAAVRSMSMSLKNFFFVSFDPSGFITIDKPPVGFWFQAISTKIFGYSGASIMLPQALSGVLSVTMIYFIVKKVFGSTAGLISSLCLAITPVFVAASRNNTIDNTLVLFLVLAAWSYTMALLDGRLRFLLLSFIFIGVGFNIKMLQAYMILPALYITYLLSSNIVLKSRLVNLLISTFILLSVSLSWALSVDFIPEKDRPYVDSSTNNSVIELIVGHNGLERLGLSTQNTTAPNSTGYRPSGIMQRTHGDGTDAGPPKLSFRQGAFPKNSSNSTGNSAGNLGSTSLNGSFGAQVKAGITRLFSKNILSDQIVWFIPLAIIGFIVSAISEKLSFGLSTIRKQSLAMWALWFLPEFIYFSWTTGTFHPYYLTMLAPPIAALAGIGIVSMWQQFSNCHWTKWFLPISLVFNASIQLLMLYYFVDYSKIIIALFIMLILFTLVPSVTLIYIISNENYHKSTVKIKFSKYLVSAALFGMFVTPLTGSLLAVTKNLSSSFPAAGLELFKNSTSNNSLTLTSKSSKLIDYLVKNKSANQKYFLVVSSSSDAADIIIKTGEPVMATGGFLGNVSSISLSAFQKLVENGDIRFVMTGGKGSGSFDSEIMTWVQRVGVLVSSSEYGSNANMQGSNQLYDLNSYTSSKK